MSSGFRSKKEIVYELLRDEIINGEHQPGSRLVIDEIAARIKVSQIPIREAIQQLEADGFVTVEPYVGARVAEMDANFIFEVFALLESMEVICSRAACSVMTDEELDQLAAMVNAMDDVVDDVDKWSAQNRAMHIFICECARTGLVMKMMHKVFDHWDRLRRFYLKNSSGSRISEAQAEHKLLLDALRGRDTDHVERVIRDHNQSALKSYIRQLESEGHLVSTEGQTDD